MTSNFVTSINVEVEICSEAVQIRHCPVGLRNGNDESCLLLQPVKLGKLTQVCLCLIPSTSQFVQHFRLIRV